MLYWLFVATVFFLTHATLVAVQKFWSFGRFNTKKIQQIGQEKSLKLSCFFFVDEVKHLWQLIIAESERNRNRRSDWGAICYFTYTVVLCTIDGVYVDGGGSTH